MNGKIISGPAAVLIVALFFLPWLAVSCDGQPAGEFSGYQLATGIAPEEGETLFAGGEIAGDPILFIIPLAGVVTLILLAITLWKHHFEPNANWGQIIVSFISILVLLLGWFQVQRESEGLFEVSIKPALWGTVIALFAIGVGAVLDLIRSNRQQIIQSTAPKKKKRQFRPTFIASREEMAQANFAQAGLEEELFDAVDPGSATILDEALFAESNYSSETILDEGLIGGAISGSETILDDALLAEIDTGNVTVLDDDLYEQASDDYTILDDDLIEDDFANEKTIIRTPIVPEKTPEPPPREKDKEEDVASISAAPPAASKPKLPEKPPSAMSRVGTDKTEDVTSISAAPPAASEPKPPENPTPATSKAGANKTEVLHIPSDLQAWLVIGSGDRRGEQIRLFSDMTIGRELSNDIVIDDTALSTHHARIRGQNGRFYLFDLDSTNGVFIFNNELNRWEKTDASELHNGDKFKLGRTVFHLMVP